LRRSILRPEGANLYLWNRSVITPNKRLLRPTIPHAAQFRFAALSPYANHDAPPHVHISHGARLSCSIHAYPPRPLVVGRGAAGTMKQSGIAPIDPPPRGRKCEESKKRRTEVRLYAEVFIFLGGRVLLVVSVLLRVRHRLWGRRSAGRVAWLARAPL